MKKSVKLGIKIAGLSIAWIPASIVALATIDVPTTLNSRAPVNKEFFRNCVKAKPAIADLPITQLAMLGSHDALSDCITINSQMDPYSPNTTNLAKLARYVGPGAMVRLSRAQSDDIYTQLNAGVRYIDARITHINGQYYTHHTMISNTLEHYLNQILKWLNENNGEFVFFHIYYFNYCKDSGDPAYESPLQAWENLYNYIDSIKPYGKSLFDYDYSLKANLEDETKTCYLKDLTYNKVTQDGTAPGAIIYFSSDNIKEAYYGSQDQGYYTEWCYRHLVMDNEQGVRTKYIINPCAGSMKASTVIDNINNAVETSKAMDAEERNKYVKYVQTQTTPNIKDIPQTITAWSLIQKAHDHNAYILWKSGIDWNDVFKYMPIYMCDFTTDNSNGFCQSIINKLAEFNTNNL